MGIYRRLESPLDITTSTIIRRIVANHEAYQVITVIRRSWVLCMQYAACCTVHIHSYDTSVDFVVYISMMCIWELLFADIVLMHYCLSKGSLACQHVSLNNVCFLGTNLPPLYYAWQCVLWCGAVVVSFILVHGSGAVCIHFCCVHVPFCRSGMRRRKPVRRSTTRVKALSTGSEVTSSRTCMKIVA